MGSSKIGFYFAVKLFELRNFAITIEIEALSAPVSKSLLPNGSTSIQQ
jgi:hypothetical protein